MISSRLTFFLTALGCVLLLACTPKPAEPTLLEKVSEVCNREGKNNYTPGGVFLGGAWSLDKELGEVTATAEDAGGQTYGGVLFKAKLKCVVSVAADKTVTFKSIDATSFSPDPKAVQKAIESAGEKSTK